MVTARAWHGVGAALVAAICMGCVNSPTGPSAELGREFTLAPGDTAQVEEAGLRVRFDRVEGDSRCPADAVCIQGGDAVVHVTVQTDDRTRAYELHTGPMTPIVHEGYTVTLVQLAPYPFSSRTIAPGDYRATLTVSR
ncbi:MAG: hypothetical protein AB7O28_13805 [Vicinamibacterales bacterium]